MSDQPDELRICPHCGQENSVYTLRCIRCGQELEALFELEGFDHSTLSAEDKSEEDLAPMAEILASLDQSPLLADSNQVEEDHQEEAAETVSGEPSFDKDAPDWLERIRQRAKEEEDAAGELAKGGIAMDDRRSQEGHKQVDEAFDEIMRRIREQNEREKARHTRRVESDLVDENGDPEWLRRIRELHPNREDDSQAIVTGSPKKDGFDDDWTEEELQELLRREMGLPETSGEETEEEITTEVSTPLPVETESELTLAGQPAEDLDSDAAQIEPEPQIFHNIPEDDVDSLSSELEGAIPSEGELKQDDAGLEPKDDGELGIVPLEEETEADAAGNAPGAVENEPTTALKEEEKAEEVRESETVPEAAVSTEEVLPDLLLLRHQRERAKVFTDIIGQEGRRTIAVLHETSKQSKIGRLVLALLLILGVLLAILVGPPGAVDLPLPAPAVAFAENLESIETSDAVLIIMDYQAATRNDIEPMAARTLEILEEKGVDVRTVTSNPENIWLTSNLHGPDHVPDEYIPGGMLGYLALAAGGTPSWGELPIDQAFNGDPDLFGGVDQLILVSDSAEFVRMWLEQITPWQPEIKTSAITTAVSSAILLPYHDSGQLQGFVAGVADAKALDVEPQNLVNQRAYQVGMLLMIVVLLLGMIMKADEDSQRRAEERKQ